MIFALELLFNIKISSAKIGSWVCDESAICRFLNVQLRPLFAPSVGVAWVFQET
jgi:hypothetical protein